MATCAYFNTAAVGLASRDLTSACHQYLDEWPAGENDIAQVTSAIAQI
jgi:hypothetical protein